MTKLSSNLPPGAGHGLNLLHDELVDNPQAIHVVIALIDCKDVKTDSDSGEITPTARFRRIEVVDPADRDAAQRIMARALERRTGQTVLPFELEQATLAAFGGIDPHTGQIIERDEDEDGKP